MFVHFFLRLCFRVDGSSGQALVRTRTPEKRSTHSWNQGESRSKVCILVPRFIQPTFRGCENLSYTMNYTDKREKLDEVVETNGVKVFVDSKAVMYLIGTEMDYVSNDLQQEFVFHNPNTKSSCGCGKSFSV